MSSAIKTATVGRRSTAKDHREMEIIVVDVMRLTELNPNQIKITVLACREEYH